MQALPEQPSCFLHLVQNDGEPVSGELPLAKEQAAAILAKAGVNGMNVIPFADGRIVVAPWTQIKRAELHDEDPLVRELDLILGQRKAELVDYDGNPVDGGR